MIVCKEEKEIRIRVCLPDKFVGNLADTNQLAKSACNMLNEIQSEKKENGKAWLHYTPVLTDIVE